MVVAQGKSPDARTRALALREETRERLLDIGKLLLTSTDIDEVLTNIAKGICDFAGYQRCLIAGVEGGSVRSMRGRAGHGLLASDVPKVNELMVDVPVLASLLQGTEPLVLQPENLAGAIPVDYIDLFHVEGTLVVLPLTDRRLGPLGLVFVDKAGRRFEPSPQELETLVDFASLASLAVQNAVLVQDSQQLATVLERSRLASELHDGVTQNLFALALALQEVLELADLPPAAVTILHKAQIDVAEGSQQLRRALFELTQDEEEPGTEGSFEDEVRQLAHQFSQRAGIGADVETRGEGRTPSPEALQLLLRTAREGLANVLKHASATQVTVVLRRSDHWWMLEVHDDGTGDATKLRRLTSGSRGLHFGLISLRREAAVLQGRMWLSQSPRLGGVQLTMSLPVRS